MQGTLSLPAYLVEVVPNEESSKDEEDLMC